MVRAIVLGALLVGLASAPPVEGAHAKSAEGGEQSGREIFDRLLENRFRTALATMRITSTRVSGPFESGASSSGDRGSSASWGTSTKLSSSRLVDLAVAMWPARVSSNVCENLVPAINKLLSKTPPGSSDGFPLVTV